MNIKEFEKLLGFEMMEWMVYPYPYSNHKFSVELLEIVQMLDAAIA